MTTSASIMTEQALQSSIISVARDHGWLVYATYRSQRSEPGFPDLVMAKPPRVIFAELKTEKGRLSKWKWNKAGTRKLPGQEEWAFAFGHCTGVEYYLWRPGDIEMAYAILMKQ
jgi:hypothetical protein